MHCNNSSGDEKIICPDEMTGQKLGKQNGFATFYLAEDAVDLAPMYAKSAMDPLLIPRSQTSGIPKESYMFPRSFSYC